MPDHDPHRPQISRRTVLSGTVWSVPLIAVAVATPALAASPPAQTSVVFGPPLDRPAGIQPTIGLKNLVGPGSCTVTAGTTGMSSGTDLLLILTRVSDPAPIVQLSNVTATVPIVVVNSFTFRLDADVAPGDSFTLSFDIGYVTQTGEDWPPYPEWLLTPTIVGVTLTESAAVTGSPTTPLAPFFGIFAV